MHISHQLVAQVSDLRLAFVVREPGVYHFVDGDLVRDLQRLTFLDIPSLVVIDGLVYVRFHLEGNGFEFESDDVDEVINIIRNSGVATYGHNMCFDPDGDFCIAMHTDGTMYTHNEDGEYCQSADVVWAIRNNLKENLVVKRFDGDSIDLLYETGYRYCDLEKRFHSASDDLVPSCCHKNGTWNHMNEWIEFVDKDNPKQSFVENVETELDWLADMAEKGEG